MWVISEFQKPHFKNEAIIREAQNLSSDNEFHLHEKKTKIFISMALLLALYHNQRRS